MRSLWRSPGLGFDSGEIKNALKSPLASLGCEQAVGRASEAA